MKNKNDRLAHQKSTKKSLAARLPPTHLHHRPHARQHADVALQLQELVVDRLAAPVLLGVEGVRLVAGDLGRLDLRLQLLLGGLDLLLRLGLQALLLLLQRSLGLLGQLRLFSLVSGEKDGSGRGGTTNGNLLSVARMKRSREV